MDRVKDREERWRQLEMMQRTKTIDQRGLREERVRRSMSKDDMVFQIA